MSVAAKPGPSMGKDPDVTSSVVKPTLSTAKSANLTLLANGTVASAKKGVYKKSVVVEEVEESDLEDDPHAYEISPETKTENGTPVSLTPTHCIWKFEDKNARIHVGISMVLPSSVGLN
jgi:hypothetical protein